MTGPVAAVVDSLPLLLSGAVVSLEMVIASLVVGLVMGIPMSLAQVYGPRVARGAVTVYVWFFRGLPNLVLLFLFFFGIFPALGMKDVSPFVIAVIVLGLRSGAYQSQIFRGAIQSLGEGQMIAARSLGMSKLQAIRSIILPQAFRLALPGWSNEYPILLTDSAVCYAIGAVELLTQANRAVTSTYEPMAIYLACALIYMILNYGGMILFHRVEKKLEIPGFGKGAL